MESVKEARTSARMSKRKNAKKQAATKPSRQSRPRKEFAVAHLMDPDPRHVRKHDADNKEIAEKKESVRDELRWAVKLKIDSDELLAEIDAALELYQGLVETIDEGPRASDLVREIGPVRNAVASLIESIAGLSEYSRMLITPSVQRNTSPVSSEKQGQSGAEDCGQPSGYQRAISCRRNETSAPAKSYPTMQRSSLEDLERLLDEWDPALDNILAKLKNTNSRHRMPEQARRQTIQSLADTFDRFHNHPPDIKSTALDGFKQEFIIAAMKAIDVILPDDISRRYLRKLQIKDVERP